MANLFIFACFDICPLYFVICAYRGKRRAFSV
nr:MAG TPA: hypothetical protein [Bacteriophage sp.]DAQ11885.1 MAG TPA: hypothetical protein [Bacteriophage sp.]